MLLVLAESDWENARIVAVEMLRKRLCEWMRSISIIFLGFSTPRMRRCKTLVKI